MAESQVLRVPTGDNNPVHEHCTTQTDPVLVAPVQDLSETGTIHFHAQWNLSIIYLDSIEPDKILETGVFVVGFEREVSISSPRTEISVRGQCDSAAEDRIPQVLRQQVQPVQPGGTHRPQLHGRNARGRESRPQEHGGWVGGAGCRNGNNGNRDGIRGNRGGIRRRTVEHG